MQIIPAGKLQLINQIRNPYLELWDFILLQTCIASKC